MSPCLLYTSLTDLLEEVPIDSARFLFNMHDAGSGIDFDLDQAVKTLSLIHI